ncbi:MAG: reverse transcriptase domain-containing protein [Candidatus Electrothrix communis]|nr:MAG: reverse transcriptase domain-containing protein [Candidatus Electrothrix communis]
MAKQYDNLYPQITDFANLHLAWRKAVRGKRFGQAAAGFELQLEDNLIRLQRELQEQTWQPGGYHSFRIYDPKPRLVSAAPFPDRVVHHALCNVLEPIYESVFISDSYANRTGKGTHAALDKTQRYIRHFPFVLQCDIRQYFPSIDHLILENILARKIIGHRTMWLIRQIIKSGEGVLRAEYEMAWFPGDKLFAPLRPRGLPIGNLTSQFWSNVYLNELDQFVKRRLRCKAYLRYVDDFLLFAASKKQLWQWKEEISSFLSELRLTLHKRSSTVYPVSSGIPFLGFRIYADHRRLKRKNGVNFARRLRRNYRAYARRELHFDDLSAKVLGWIAHADHGDTWGLRTSLFHDPLPKKQPR